MPQDWLRHMGEADGPEQVLLLTGAARRGGICPMTLRGPGPRPGPGARAPGPGPGLGAGARGPGPGVIGEIPHRHKEADGDGGVFLYYAAFLFV